MRFLLHFSRENVKNNVWMGNLHIFHQNFTVLSFVTLYFKKTNSCPGRKGSLGVLPSSLLKKLENMKEDSAYWVQNNHWNLRKKTFFNAVDNLDAGGDQKQVFFWSCLIIVFYLYDEVYMFFQKIKLQLLILIFWYFCKRKMKFNEKFQWQWT